MKITEIRRTKLRLWADKHGIPAKEKSYFSQIFSGGSFGERAARRIETDYQMGEGYLDDAAGIEGLEGAIEIRANRKTRDFVGIPQYKDVAGGMGRAVVLRDQPGEIQNLTVSPEWVNKNIKRHSGIHNLCIVTGFGTSMEPLYKPGDPLIIDRGVKTVDADAIYFFRVGDEGFIKMLQRVPGEGIRVISKNKDWETWTIKPDMDFEVFGLVLKAWSSTDVW